MAKLVTWNCNGLSDSKKIDFLKSNLSGLKKVDFTLLIETHLSDSNGVIDELRDLEITHEVTHSFRNQSDTHAGLCFIISRNYSVIEGRIPNLKCESKAEPGTIYNLVGFYGHTSNKAASLRQDTVNALKDALSMTHTNVLMGDFNFVEDSLDRNGKLPNNLGKKTDFDSVDTFRILNPLSGRYSFTHQNKKSRSRIHRIYVTDKESGKVMRQGFIDTPWRDHKIITVEMNETSERGPGQWALNTDLLKDPKFQN